MSNQFIGEIRMFGFNFAPRGWAFCNGALLAINPNQALFVDPDRDYLLAKYEIREARTLAGPEAS